MARDVIMPALGMAQESGVLIRWLVPEGGTVAEGDPLMEVETDKAVVEVPATASGTLAAVAYGEGAEVAVGTVLAVLLAPGESPGDVGSITTVDSHDGAAGAVSVATSATATPQVHGEPLTAAVPTASATPAGATPAVATPIGAAPARATAPAAPRAVLASPKAKRLARELGLDLTAVAGTGPGGAIRAVDLPHVGAAAAPVAAGRTETGPLRAVQPDAAWLRSEVDVAGLSEFLARVVRTTADKSAAALLFRGTPAEAGALVIDVADVLTRAVAAGLNSRTAFRSQGLRLRLTIRGTTNTFVDLAGGQTVSILSVARARADQTGADQTGADQTGVGHDASTLVEVVDRSSEVFDRSPPPLDPTTAIRFTLGPIKEVVAVHEGVPSVRKSATLSLEYRTSALDDDSAAELITYVGRILGDPFSLALAG